jgi:hypothetical protein
MRTSLAGVARQLGTPVTPPTLIDWVEWAFTQKEHGDASGLSQLIATLEQPSRPSAEIVPPPPSIPDAPTRRLAPKRPRAVLPELRRPRRRGLWIFLLVLLVAVALAIAAAIALGPEALWRAVTSL